MWFTYQGPHFERKRKGRRLRQRERRKGSAVFVFFLALSLSGPLFVFFLSFCFSPDAALRRLRNVRWLTGLTVGVLAMGTFFSAGHMKIAGGFGWRDCGGDAADGGISALTFFARRESSENLGFSRGNTLHRAIGFNWSLFCLEWFICLVVNIHL